MLGKVQECTEGPRLQADDTDAGVPVPMVQTVLKTVEAPGLQFIDVVGEVNPCCGTKAES